MGRGILRRAKGTGRRHGRRLRSRPILILGAGFAWACTCGTQAVCTCIDPRAWIRHRQVVSS